MTKRNLYILIAVIAVLVIAIGIYFYNKSSPLMSPAFCYDSDNGLNYNVKGNCSDKYYPRGVQDICWAGVQQVKEMYCNANKQCQAKIADCSNGCSNGACVTSPPGTTVLTYNRNTDEGFVATWTGVNRTETYTLKAIIRPSDGINYTTIKDYNSGAEYCMDKRQGENCYLGNVILTIQAIDYKMNTVTFKRVINPSIVFNRLVDINGYYILLPTQQQLPTSQYTFTIKNFKGDTINTTRAYWFRGKVKLQ